MIEVRVEVPVTAEIPCVTISNIELIRGILAMPDNEYIEVASGILRIERSNINRYMLLFAHIGNQLKNSKLDPAQKNSIEEYIKDFKLCQI